jgi:diguanylate cyclase (GGDEF)-like protein
MRASTFFLHGKIARRLFFIFLGFTLVPVCVISIVAITRLSDATNEQINRGLENEVKNFSYLVLERLDFAEQVLIMHREELAAMSAQELRQAPGIILAQRGLMVSLQTLNFIQRTELQDTYKRLENGRLLMLARHEGQRYPQIYLTAALRPDALEAGLVTVKLTPDFVLGVWDTRNLGIDSCILDRDQRPLYTTREHLCDNFLAAAGALSHKGEVSFDDDISYFSRYRSLFLEDKFGIPNWKIAIIQPEDDIFLASLTFRNYFLAAALVVILCLSLLSLYLIRTRMAPLASIMDGIRRVSDKRYDQPVDVTSGDEFQDLAEAFNSMSGQVSRQLVTMASMADIDQLILTRIKKEDIIRVVLEKTGEVLPCECTGLVVLQVGEDAGCLYRLGGEESDFYTQDVCLSRQQREQLCFDAIWLQRGDDEQASFFALFPENINALQLIPVIQDKQQLALIVLGHIARPDLDQEDLALARSYADRIAVALANAEWEEKLFYQAHFDTLTDLPNRLSMLDRLNRSTEQAQRAGESFAVLFIDLDDFKLVNDSLGHHAGDEMIAIMASRLQSCLRAGDTVARMGGDEFVMISDAFTSNESTVAAMMKVANKVMEEVAMPLEVCGREVRSSSSIGIAIYPRDGSDSTTLLKNADTAMYHAKSMGRGNFQFFSEELNAESVELMNLSSDIKRALENDEFELHYQPKISLQGKHITGAEALIRWHHPERGMVPPGDFIEVAERMGLIGAIGDWTLHETCRQICAWQAAGIPVPRISVNVSAIQIHQQDFANKIADLLDAYRLDPRLLEIEIVEGVLVADMATTTAKLIAIRELGVHISIDDYGTGYSSLSYVRSFPVDTLKIDRCFITNICDNNADRAIVNSTIVLAHNLKLNVIAEGVENLPQAQLLQELGCDQIQGYYYSRPIDAGAIADLFSNPTLPTLKLINQ